MRTRALSNALTACVTTLTLCLGGAQVAAAGPEEATDAEREGAAEPANPEGAASQDSPPEDEGTVSTEDDPPAPEDEGSVDGGSATSEPLAVEVEEDPDAPTSSGGIGGHVTDRDDPEADRARTDLEGEALEDTDDVPEKMERMEAAAWWTMFGAVALGTAGGVFAGLAESRVDEAERLGLTVGEDGKFSQYDDDAAEYEDLTQAARTHNAVAITMLSLGGAALVASIALFGVNASRKRKEAQAVQARGGIGPTGASLEVKF